MSCARSERKATRVRSGNLRVGGDEIRSAPRPSENWQRQATRLEEAQVSNQPCRSARLRSCVATEGARSTHVCARSSSSQSVRLLRERVLGAPRCDQGSRTLHSRLLHQRTAKNHLQRNARSPCGCRCILPRSRRRVHAHIRGPASYCHSGAPRDVLAVDRPDLATSDFE